MNTKRPRKRGTYRRASGPPNDIANPPIDSVTHSMRFWARPGMAVSLRVARSRAPRTIAMTIQVVRIVDEIVNVSLPPMWKIVWGAIGSRSASTPQRGNSHGSPGTAGSGGTRNAATTSKTMTAAMRRSHVFRPERARLGGGATASLAFVTFLLSPELRSVPRPPAGPDRYSNRRKNLVTSR